MHKTLSGTLTLLPSVAVLPLLVVLPAMALVGYTSWKQQIYGAHAFHSAEKV